MESEMPKLQRLVLFVDDEENILKSLKRLFTHEDFEVLTALSGAEGLELLKTHKVPVIVSDQRMPGMAGAEFLEKAQAISPDSIRMILTGYADISAAMDAINKGGAYRYIAKPWNDTDLVLVVKDALEKYRLHMENRYLLALTARQNEELKKWSAELEIYVQQQTIDLTRRNKELHQQAERLEKNLQDMITAFSHLIELRDRHVHSHSTSVERIARGIATRLNLSEEEVQIICTAAKLHDIGKIVLPDIILTKDAEALNAEEMTEYIKHSIRGQAAIDGIEALRTSGILIRHHHEAYNGTGFPDRLKGEAIPLGARIIAMADKFDHLIHLNDLKIESALMSVRPHLGVTLDNALFPLLQETVRYMELTFIVHESGEHELNVKNLTPGMTVTRDVRSGTGLLLLSKGTVLTAQNIETLLRGYHLDPSKSGVFVKIAKK